jgi:hypothetical protein
MTRFFITGILVMAGLLAFGQNGGNSPFSRLGIGDLMTSDYVAIRSMGGLSASFSDANLVNVSNPASLGKLANTAFEIGVDARYSRLKEGQNEAGFWGGSINYLSLAFPLINPINQLLDQKELDLNWGMNLALLPFSRVSYENSFDEEMVNIGSINRQFKGSGGINQVLIGNGIRYKNFYAGVNLGYLFGKIKNERAVLYQEYTLPFHNHYSDEVSYTGLSWKIGLQYYYIISEGKEREDRSGARSITFGLFGNGPLSIKTTSNYLYSKVRQSNSYFGLGSDLRLEELDTLAAGIDLEQDGQLPAEISLGAVYRHGDKFMVGVNFTSNGWSDYENLADFGNFDDTWEFSIGGQFIPDINSYNYFHHRIRYRAGAYFGMDPRVIDGEQLKNFGLTLGFGLPVVAQRQLSFVNLGLEYGRRAGDTLIKENYLKFYLGITLNSNLWFYKRKFN